MYSVDEKTIAHAKKYVNQKNASLQKVSVYSLFKKTFQGLFLEKY